MDCFHLKWMISKGIEVHFSACEKWLMLQIVITVIKIGLAQKILILILILKYILILVLILKIFPNSHLKLKK
jgi:hypothetical protein